MLVLSRKKDQSILIGDSIVIKILKTEHGHIKIGIDAPTELKILRQELLNGEVSKQPHVTQTAIFLRRK